MLSRTGIAPTVAAVGSDPARGASGGARKLACTVLCAALVFVLAGELCRGREVQYLTFSVQNHFGIYVRDLKREEVELKLDGRPVDVGYLAPEVDTAVAIFLENSPRTAENAVSVPQFGQINLIDRVRYAMLDDFFPPLTRTGHVLLAQFFDKIEILQDFTDDESYLLNALNRLQPDPEGIVFDQISVGRVIGKGVDMLKARPERRKVLFLVTRTVDRKSAADLDEYQLMLRNTGVDLYVLSLAPQFVSGTGARFEEKINAYFFRNLVKETAGKAYLSGEYKFMEDLFTDLKGRLLQTYTIGFYVEPGRTVEDHEVEIHVERQDARVTCRKYLVY